MLQITNFGILRCVPFVLYDNPFGRPICNRPGETTIFDRTSIKNCTSTDKIHQVGSYNLSHTEGSDL